MVLSIGGGEFVNGAGVDTANVMSVIQWARLINFDSASIQGLFHRGMEACQSKKEGF